MNTTITMKQLGEALDRPVELASAMCSKTKCSKKILFIPSELRYRVIHDTEHYCTTTSEKHPHDALEAYNAIII